MKDQVYPGLTDEFKIKIKMHSGTQNYSLVPSLPKLI